MCIADFGLASIIEDGQVLERGCGSTGYIAPEILNQEGYGIQADMFSIGAILHILLVGRKVFSG